MWWALCAAQQPINPFSTSIEALISFREILQHVVVGPELPVAVAIRSMSPAVTKSRPAGSRCVALPRSEHRDVWCSC